MEPSSGLQYLKESLPYIHKSLRLGCVLECRMQTTKIEAQPSHWERHKCRFKDWWLRGRLIITTIKPTATTVKRREVTSLNYEVHCIARKFTSSTHFQWHTFTKGPCVWGLLPLIQLYLTSIFHQNLGDIYGSGNDGKKYAMTSRNSGNRTTR